MAKGSGEPPAGGRRPSSSSRSAKPYDANNSFVKKMATKVTDFIPQSSWISKWFNTSQSNEDTLDVRGNSEESELVDDTQQPPPSKRPRIRMDVIHPPGTFSIQPRNKAALNTVDSCKEQYSVRNEVSEDFLEPAVAGPSGIGRLISSTPATQADIKTVTFHRSDLNSLTSSTNNGTVNGTDDHSESSESTSGCSSLIPQINRQEGPSNLLYSSFSSRKRHIDDKLTFTNHLQSPRSLFLDSNSRDTLSSRRPSFNASVMTNTLDRASPLSSPFYSGNTTFGGANAAGLYKRNRNLFNNSSELQLKIPRRTNVQVKPSNATEVDSSGMSQTAKKILEALEHFSSPISDAKKIPLRNADNAVSTLMGGKRMREEESPSARVGLRHLTRELTVPTVPDILKLRRRQKLQDTTVAARKIVSARSDPPPSMQEYQLRTEDGNREKYHGKIRGKSKINLEEEETVEPVNLPNIPLPISTLPSFNFTVPPAPHVLGKTTVNREDTFTFASPIKVTSAEKSLQSYNNFTFSSPINAEDNTNIKIDSSSPLRTQSAASPTSSVDRTTMPNFIWTGSSTAPRLKEKTKNSKDSSVTPVVAHELKSGSVMDILCPNCNKTESNFIAQSNSRLMSSEVSNSNTSSTSDSDIKKARHEFSSAGSSIAKPQSDWECSECLIRNSSSDKWCAACKIVRSNPNEKISPPSSTTTDIVVKTKPVVNDCFGSQFKLSANQWECTACYVRNKQSDIKCVACLASRPASKSAMQQPVSTSVKYEKSDLIERFKPAEGSWECSGCLLRNAANVITCPCCNTSKPTSVKASSKTTNVAMQSTAQKLISVGVENTQAAESSSSDIMSKFKPSKDSWECPGCLVRNNSSTTICPCCNTSKSTPVGDSSKIEQTSTTNGFGDKFKKPEGAWNCDSCLVQNDAKSTKCVACQAIKPGTTKSSEPASNTSSTVQFKFGVPSSTGVFKFGIDKSDNQSTASPLNGFKFGNAQQSSGTGQFTFGIPKEGIKTAGETSKTSGIEISSSGTGFHFNVKVPEKSGTKSNQEIKEGGSFSLPKSDSSTTASEKPTTSIASSTTTSVLFKFGAQKPGFNQPVLSKEAQNSSFVTKVTESSKPVEAVLARESTSIDTSTTLPSLLTKNYTSQSDAKPIFSFGASSTSVSSSNTSTSMTTTCLPTFAQPTVTFSDSKTTPQTTGIPSFGQIPTSSAALTTNVSFGRDKMAEATSVMPSGNKSVTSDTSAAPIFPIVSSSASLFNNNESKTPIAFGADKPSAFASTDRKPTGFATPESKIPAFGNSDTENKSTMFGTPDTKLPVFGNSEKTVSVFNPPSQATAVNPLPTFGAPSSVTPSPFGSSSDSNFANNATAPAFGPSTTPAIFSSTKPNDGNTSQANPASLFTFGSNQSAQQSTSGGFNFSANANPTGSAPKQALFTFGSSNMSQSNSVFSGGTFANPASSTTTANFTFNAPKQEPSTFGQGAVTTPMFGANPQAQATPSSNMGFNFGSTAPPAAPTVGGFNFGGMSSTSTPTAGFNFNPPPAFDPNSRPSFNFTKGNAPTTFNAPTASAPRKIKKAFRRCVR